MTTENDTQAKGNTFHWRIENLSQCWWLKRYEKICSPCFTADILKDTKWSLHLYPMGDENENSVGIYIHREEDCNGSDVITVSYHFSFLNKNGSILKEDTAFNDEFSKGEGWGFINFEERERLFFTDREKLLPEDVLIIQCSVWNIDEKPENFDHIFATTVLKVKRRSFVWRIDKISALDLGITNRFKDNLIHFKVCLQKDLNYLDMVITALDKRAMYISCDILIMDSEGERKMLDSKIYSANDLKEGVLPIFLLLCKELKEDKCRYLSKDTFSVKFEFVLSTIEHFTTIEDVAKLENKIDEIEKSQPILSLINDLEFMYINGISSDMELRTPTKSFPIHKCVLSARSPVFQNMFRQNMEKNSGYVDIIDFENDTIHQMLLYMYTGSLQQLDFQSFSKLYKIADKYQILCLKHLCSSLLKEKLHPTNACDALVLADLCNDDDLMKSVEDYVVEHSKEIFYSQEWKDVMSLCPKTAADIMYRKITMNKMCILTQS